METHEHQLAARANATTYGSEATRKYIDGAPHIKHPSLRGLYETLVSTVYDFASKHNSTPEVLDLGAGEGSTTLPFLKRGARVMVVDISESQLQMLQSTCADYPTLEVRCLDVADAINSIQAENKQYAIVIAISFLHHVPDYLGLIRQAVTVMSPYGQFFSFQDPLRYDSIGRFTAVFSTLAYFSWRVFKGDVVGGIKRRIRRSTGIYLEDSPEDNAEYHVVRNGVDQAAICDLLGELGFECEIVRYFSTQSRVWQSIGAALGLRNTFAVIAKRIPIS